MFCFVCFFCLLGFLVSLASYSVRMWDSPPQPCMLYVNLFASLWRLLIHYMPLKRSQPLACCRLPSPALLRGAKYSDVKPPLPPRDGSRSLHWALHIMAPGLLCSAIVWKCDFDALNSLCLSWLISVLVAEAPSPQLDAEACFCGEHVNIWPFDPQD